MAAWQKTLLIFVGAGVGANLRYWLGLAISDRWGSAFPWATLTINVTGSFLLGLFMGHFLRSQESQGLMLLVAVGLLGGYTTFSTFSMEAVNLLSLKTMGSFAAYVIGSCALSIAGAWLGLLLSR